MCRVIYLYPYRSTHDHLLTYWRTSRAKGRALPELRARDGGWRVLEGRPQGCLHCGLLLLRASTFLRVVVCGSNLDGQLERDRDALFVQDRAPRYLVITPSSSCRTAPPPPRRAAASDI